MASRSLRNREDDAHPSLPVKRLIEPEEVADLALYLCSPQMSFTNGSSFTLDGGWTAR